MGISGSKLSAAAIVAISLTETCVDARKPWGISHTALLSLNHQVQSNSPVIFLRGGDDEDSSTSTHVDLPPAVASTAGSGDEEPSLDEKVYAAMKKLGMSPPTEEEDGSDGGECQDGVRPVPSQEVVPTSSTSATIQSTQDPHLLADSIAKAMNVDSRLAMAAVGATSTYGNENQRIYNEQAARDMIQFELDLIDSIPTDSPDVEKLVEEGFDPFLSRRALAFAENNMDDARAILIADQMDEEEELRSVAAETNDDDDEEESIKAQLRKEKAAQITPSLVEVRTDFDPTALSTTPKAKPAAASAPPAGSPKPAPKESVVFEATTAQIQELVLESPVPVLLDIYADWCGPCKVLGPALEEMAVKSGGIFRLVKVNSDNERPVSGALEVTALPTVYGVRDGKIVHMFQGMPNSEDMMKNFMMGLFGAAPFSPPVSSEQSEKYKELTAKLVKTAGAACFSFSARERLVDRINTKLDALVLDDSVADVEGSAGLLRTLMSNIVNNPYEMKFRKVNLENKVIGSKLGSNSNALAVLKSVGFAKSGSQMILGNDKKVVNVAPLVVARDCIDKWIQKNRNEMAAAARRRKDEADRAKLQTDMEATDDDEDEAEDDVEEEELDTTACKLKLRLDGKNKIHEATLHENDPLSAVLGVLNVSPSDDEEVQITCVAKRLIVKSSNKDDMKKSLKEHGLLPSASIVVKVGESSNDDSSTTRMRDRVAAKAKKKGTHTMQSVGIYSKDDNNKAELIDGGGGVWYEHDISDDEVEAKTDETTDGNEGGDDGDRTSQETDTIDET